MRYRTIPGTDLHVSELAFGNFIFGSFMWGKTAANEPEGIALQDEAFDLGVNFFDTGDAYDNGRAETMMAPTIRRAGRDKIILSTKNGYDFYTDPGSAGSHRERKQDFSYAFLAGAIEKSLQRMGTDYIDLWQAHNIKLPQMTDEFRSAMAKLVQDGKIRHWGIALGPAIGWREEGAMAIEHWPECVVVQTVFNLLEQHPGREFCERAERTKTAGIVARVPHSSGILQDMYTADMTFDDHRKFRDRNWLIYGLKKIEMLRHIQKSHGGTMGQLALRWLLTWPTCVSVQPNITSSADLQEFAAACDGGLLLPHEMSEIEGLAERDFDLGPDAHACDLKSSIEVSGRTRSGYQMGDPVPLEGGTHVAAAPVA
jgi:aryl-alcohol dehydrogenase-like predicted oxidoreductase